MNGFVPFLGPSLGFERLSVVEEDHGTKIIDTEQILQKMGIIFGWDIRPSANNFFILRTNLRYTSDLSLALPSGKKISFTQFEFNFIQIVLHFR